MSRFSKYRGTTSRDLMEFQKSQPTPGDVHINTPLTNISVAYIQDQDAFIASKVFPMVPVQKQSDLYFLYNKDDFLRDEAKVRAPGTESAGGGFAITTDSYNAYPYAYHKDLDDQLMANADAVLSLDRTATEFVTQKMLIRQETLWHTNYFTTGVWGTDATPSSGMGTIWSTYATSTPREDVDLAKAKVKSATGFEPNTLVVSDNVFYTLRSHPEIRDQFKYTSAASIDEAMMAQYFGVKRFLRSGAVSNTAAEGLTGTEAFIAGKNALLVYSAPAPSLLMPTAGYTFVWSGYLGAVNGVAIRRFRIEPIRSYRIEGEIAFAQKVVASALGYFFSGVVA